MELIRANDTGEKSMAVKRSLFVGHAANKYIVKILTPPTCLHTFGMYILCCSYKGSHEDQGGSTRPTMSYVSSYIMILIHFNYLYRDIIVYRDKLSTNYRDKKFSLSPKPTCKANIL